MADGANTLNGLTFGLAEPEPALNEARKAAVADARAKAELLVDCRRGEAGPSRDRSPKAGPGPIPSRCSATQPRPRRPVAGGELAMTANVTIQYEMTE